MPLDKVQFTEPVDSSTHYKSLREWITVGISEFLNMMQMQEPKHLTSFDTKIAQVGALRECARLIRSNDTETKPNLNSLLSWYQYSIMLFVSSTFANVPKRLLPDDIPKGDELKHIENVVIDVLSRHGGANWKDPELNTNAV